MRKSEKITYEIDPLNLPKFRNVVDGRYTIDKNNNLIYQVKSSSSYPKQIKLKGSWSLDKNHNLILRLDKDNRFKQDSITLEGEIINTTADKLEFSITTKDSSGNAHFYILRLSGRWQSDKYNRLIFSLSKEKGLHDELVFSGTWEVNKQNQITYTYAKTILKRKTKITREIIFKGFWNIVDKYRIIYVLDKKINSFFDFSVSIGKPAKRGLEYEIGIGVHQNIEKIILFGSWRVNEKLGLLFEMPYEDGKLRGILFGAACKFVNNYDMEFRLRNTFRKDLGISLKFSKTFLDDQGQIFAQAVKEGKEFSLVAGVGFRW